MKKQKKENIPQTERKRKMTEARKKLFETLEEIKPFLRPRSHSIRYVGKQWKTTEHTL